MTQEKSKFSKNTFSDLNKLDLMVRLRRNGWTYQSIGLFLDVDHSAVYQHCKKLKVKKDRVGFSIYNIITSLSIKVKVKKEKMYKDYLEESKLQVFCKNISI